MLGISSSGMKCVKSGHVMIQDAKTPRPALAGLFLLCRFSCALCKTGSRRRHVTRILHGPSFGGAHAMLLTYMPDPEQTVEVASSCAATHAESQVRNSGVQTAVRKSARLARARTAA